MSTKYKILEDFYDDSFELIAVHSSMEDYKVAFNINTTLNTKLKRSKNDVELSANISFPLFEWMDEMNENYWVLFPNSISDKSNSKMKGLFLNESSCVKHYVVPEYKEVDYFIKLEQELEAEQLKAIMSIPNIQTAYKVDSDTLESKNNLIF